MHQRNQAVQEGAGLRVLGRRHPKGWGMRRSPYLNSAALDIGRHVSRIADPFSGHTDEFRISHLQRSDGWIETTYDNMSDTVPSP
jgi:hypothetical protein